MQGLLRASAPPPRRRDNIRRMLATKLARRLLLSTCLIAGTAGAERPPVLDMHLHALPADAQGPPPLAMCTPLAPFPAWDQRRPYPEQFIEILKNPQCDDPIWSPENEAELLSRTVDVMARNNVFGVLSGTLERVQRWKEAAPERFIRGHAFMLDDDAPSPQTLERLHGQGRIEVLAEVTNQYAGISPDDRRMAPYWAMAERLDLPVGIHIGTGPPGAIYLGAGNYRARMHSPLDLEDVLVAHPKLRVYVMHAGFPMLDDTLALLYSHPQVYVETGVIVYTQTRKAFYRYLKALVEGGFGNRIMFGSDQMVWPEAIERSIQVVEAAEFLSQDQKRDILYYNAARFLRLSEETIRRHYAGASHTDT